jgi:hypothetical protein
MPCRLAQSNLAAKCNISLRLCLHHFHSQRAADNIVQRLRPWACPAAIPPRINIELPRAAPAAAAIIPHRAELVAAAATRSAAAVQVCAGAGPTALG